MQIWIHDNKMKKIVALNNDIPDMLSYTNSSWHSYLDQATSTFDFTIPKFSNGELHEDLKLINDECFVSFYVNGSYQVFYIATLQEDDFNIQLTCNNTNLEYALEYVDPFSSDSAQTIEWYLNKMYFLSYAAVEIGNNEISDRKRTLTFDSQETKMNRLQSLMSKFEAEFEFKVELNRDGTYKRIAINIYQENHIGTDRKDVVLYYSNGLKGVQVNSDKTQMFTSGIFTGKDGLNLANVEISEKNSDGIEEFYSRKGDVYLRAPLAMQRYPSTMRVEGQDNWINKDFQTEYENVNDLKAYALRTLKQYAYPLVTYTASVQSGFVSHYTDLKLGDTIRIIDKNFVGGLALEARVSEMIISFDNPANNSFVFTNYRKLDNKPSSALQTRIEQAVESKLPYRIELATTGGVTFKNNEGETIIKPSLYKGNLPWTKDVTWHWTLNGVVTDGMQYRIRARDIIDTAVLTVDAFVDGKKVATTEITLTNVNDGLQGPQGPQGDEGPQGPQGDEGPKGDKGDTGNGIANTVITYGLSMSDTTEPATWSSDRPALVKGMYLWIRTVIIYTNGESTTSYQISYIPKDADATAEIDKTKQELLEKLETVRDDSLAAVEDAKQQLVTVRDESLAAAEEAKQQVATVADELSTAKQDFQNAVSAVDTKATNLQSDLTQAKQDLASQAQQLREQASAQSELTNRVSSVEKTANGTKTTVSELSKTVAQNGKDITSVTARTKVVEDDLAGTKTTLSQVQTMANTTSQKTATLETGLNGLSARFNSLSVGNKNYLPASRVVNRGCSNFSYSNTTKSWTMTAPASSSSFGNGITFNTNGLNILLNGGETLFFGLMIKANKACSFNYDVNNALSGTTSNDNDDTSKRTNYPSNRSIPANVWTKVWFSYTAKANVAITENNSNFGIVNNTEPVTIEIKEVMVAKSNVPVDYQMPDAELEQKIAEYKQNADQNYASLQTTVQNLDGTVQHNKTVADQTAAGFKTRIESLETYKDGESERANAYFESAKTETAKQLTAERTAIAKDYVAKSTYTSDVTGLRNDLSATTTTANTTKTNLANYQASNDRAVANLQSNLQTANGNISSLKTKVEAVPGQITSAVSSVEGKIPTEIGAVNLFKGSRDFSGSWMNAGNGVYAEDYNGVKIFKTQVMWNGCSQYFEVKAGEEYVFSAYVKSSAKTDGVNFYLLHELKQPMASGLVSFASNNNQDNIGFGLTDKYQRIAIKIKITKDGWIMPRIERYNSDAYLFFGGYKLERGNIATDYSPAPEDAISQISSLSSELTQTKDGITLLATKTELNTAKNELQSGINTATNKANSNAQTITTHTNQISALNTGLSAKVSQSDFNTLSGRVTNAENNITAKANELSSKITSVEGKIPTEIGAVNLFKGSRDFSGSWMNAGNGVYAEDYKGVKIFKTQVMWNGCSQYFEVKAGEEYVFSAYVKSSAKTDGVNFYLLHELKQPMASGLVSFASNNNQDNIGFGLTDKYQRIAIKIKITKDGWIMPRIERYNSDAYLFFGGYKLERGNIATDYSPAPEDAISQISSLSSELTQTKDGITLLATKTELNTAKNELQSGINTATNKANSNAQTITTHTNQISALNTGLSAKVSQSDFNTLSGRVTNAENNITAKANELSSKITSVEGKIPTEIGAVNLFKGSRDFSGSWMNAGNGVYAEDYKGVKIFKRQNVWDGLSQYFEVKTGEEYVFSAYVRSSAKTDGVNFYLLHESKQPMASGLVSFASNNNQDNIGFGLTDKYQRIAIKIKITKDGWIMPRIERYNSDAYLFFGGYKLERGNIATDYSPAPEDHDSKLAAAQSEFKQTTDSIKASVSSLDQSTIKSSSLTINSDGIVMKAGKSTTDVANAIGSYFAVNQNAINLFSDKINVKGSMIVDGAITSNKIAANSITSDKIVASGITANVIRGGVLNALNNAMQVNLDDSNITFSNNASVIFTSSDNALKRVIADKPSQFIKMYDDNFVSELGLLKNSTLTVVGSNADRTESSDSSGFGGLRIWNGRSSTDNTSFVELVGNRVAIYGNKNRSPWLFDMTTTTSILIPQNSNGIKHSLGRSDRPFYSVYADNMYIQGERVAMMLKDIALHIGYGGNNGWVGRIQ